MNHKRNANVLIVDDRSENLLVLESLLEDMDCNIIKATSGNDALGLMLVNDFALVLLDVQMPEMDGFETAELMRGSEKTRYVPIIFVTAIIKEQKCIFKGYEVGAVDYLFKPIDPIVLKSKIRVFLEIHNQKKMLEDQSELLKLRIKELTELKEANFRLENLSLSDGLTGISNRRSYDQYLEMSWRNAIRTNKSLSLIMADIDYFKTYNDNYGHIKGDACLIKVAQAINQSLKRPMDQVSRYGGDEFTIILPETDSEGALKVAEEIRRNIEKLQYPHDYSKIALHVTLSLGVATIIPQQSDQIIEFIKRADSALYNSKQAGRNRVSNF